MTEASESARIEPRPADKDDIRALSARLDEATQQLTRIGEMLRIIDRRTLDMPRGLLTDIQALQQLLRRYEPEATLPQVSGWALSPRGLLTMVDLIESAEAQLVVECGSGTSTLWIAYALRELGHGKVVALEHLPEYAMRTQAVIDDHGLGWFADVRLAPLRKRSTDRGDYLWYDFEPRSLHAAIDVLLVDGPPQDTGRHARYPALPLLRDRLAPGARILCDDTNRRDEKEMIDYWLEDEPRLARQSSPAPDLEVLMLRA
ncbi:class I SAM-dependent methyltransferase [Microbacterium sp. NEAU-LLC]|uniref:Class I SAM-dependent methyltransferase n=1 Tax=Microbacterium helvum TaxID=2773713 RepID=A0ABR8NSL2_9MICO|nr:class I SAM-dependent methyltransferase [Microbacterium helvum]MBD3942546.1 class I SAM-dependent methyltransferase [Microbacterium helvum]